MSSLSSPPSVGYLFADLSGLDFTSAKWDSFIHQGLTDEPQSGNNPLSGRDSPIPSQMTWELPNWMPNPNVPEPQENQEPAPLLLEEAEPPSLQPSTTPLESPSILETEPDSRATSSASVPSEAPPRTIQEVASDTFQQAPAKRSRTRHYRIDICKNCKKLKPMRYAQRCGACYNAAHRKKRKAKQQLEQNSRRLGKKITRKFPE
jgi:hypothetical protein